MPVATAAILLALTKVQWYDRVLVPLYNGGSYSGVVTKSYVAMAGDILLVWGAAFVSLYGVEQMVLLWQGEDSFVVRPPVVTYGRHPNARGGEYTWEDHLKAKKEREDYQLAKRKEKAS